MPPYPRNSPQAAARIVAAVEHWGLHREMLQPELAERGVEHV